MSKKLEIQRTKFLVARNERQKEYIKLIKTKVITFAIGPPGVGRTFLACAIALEELYKENIDKIYITRPILEAGGESLGFLPGNTNEKIAPYLVPIYESFQEFIDTKELNDLINKGKIEAVPLAFLRGRTFRRCIIIGDEFQNAKESSIRNLLCRIGEGAKLIINADFHQSDLPYYQQGAIKKCIDILCTGDIPEIGFVKFEKEDIVRHPLIGVILDKLDGAHIAEEETPKDYWRYDNEE